MIINCMFGIKTREAVTRARTTAAGSAEIWGGSI